MNLKKIFIGIATIAFSSIAQTINAQQIENGKIQDITSTYHVGLSHKLNLSDADIKVLGKVCASNGLPTKCAVREALSSHKATLAKNRKAIKKTPVIREAYTASDTVLWESFESWDGSFNWTPSDWTEFSISEQFISASMEYNPTWEVYETDGYYAPYATDGKYVASLTFSYDLYDADSTLIQQAHEQDEWIVSPTISDIKASNYLFFNVGYAPISQHYFYENGEEVLDFERKSFDLEVLVTTTTRTPSNDESRYTSVFKLSDVISEQIKDAANSSDSTSLSNLMNFAWNYFALPLNEFEGHNIRVAFRYKGFQGGTIILDAIRVSDKLPVANYATPEGSFFYGFSQDGKLITGSKYSLLPADRKSVWKNMSNKDSETFEWAYALPEDLETLNGKSSEQDLTIPANRASGFYKMPELTARSTNRYDTDDIDGMYKFGGNSAFDDGNGGTVLLGMTNWDPTKSYWWGQITEGKYLFGTGAEIFFGQTKGSTGKVTGIANYYDKPSSPYIMSSVWLPLYKCQTLTKNLRFNCTVYKAKIEEDGTTTITDEVIANTYTTAGNVTLTTNGIYFMTFNFDEPIVIDDAVMIYIDGFQQKNILEIAPFAQPLPHDSDINYALLSLETTNSSYILYPLEGLITNATGVGNAKSSFCIHTNATFPYLYSIDGYTFEVPNDGGEKTFNCDTFFSPDEWTIEGLPNWAKIEKTIDETNATVSVKFQIEALPTDVQGRSANVKITSLCNSMTFTLLQGSEITGIQNVDKCNTAMVRLADNTLQLDYVEGINSVAVYNASGMLIKSAVLPASGTYSFDASDLSCGTYIVRFGGKYHPTVKVLKK
jgi:hypothetical protein